MVVNIVRAHISRYKIGNILGSVVDLISADVTENSKLWTMDDDTYAKVNCDVTMFTIDVDWIARDLIVISFGLKNLNIQFVKRCENKTNICLVRFLFF